MNPETENFKGLYNIPEPFSLLEIDPQGKSLSELYRELHFRAEEEFKEHCYRSMKNYTFQKFRVSEFYKRYQFLRGHLDELCEWLYPKEENHPPALREAQQYRPEFINPWGVKEYPSRLYLNFKKKKHQLLANEIKTYLSNYFKLPLKFIQEDANLYTLSLLSDFFQEGRAAKIGLEIDDIDPNKLFIPIKNLPIKAHKNSCEIAIDKLLIKKERKDNIYIEEKIGLDGFASHVINLSLCFMEIPPEIEKHLKEDDALDHVQTVEELLRAFIVPQKP